MKWWLIFIWFPALAYGQLSFDISPREIGINEYIQFTMRIEGSQVRRIPSFEPRMETGDFELVSGRPSQSSQTSIINGRVSASVSFTYELRPTKKGSLVFPAQSVVYEGKRYQSEATTIEVGDQNRRVTIQKDPFADPFESIFRRNRSRTQRQGEVFGTVEVPKDTYYLGEPIPLEICIYTTPGLYIISRESAISPPDFKDFWVEEVPLNPREPEPVIRDGKRYNKTLVFKRKLFANRIGELVIDAAEFRITVSTSASRFMLSGQTLMRYSEPVTLTVNPLPARGKPDNFSGLVGSFDIQAELDQQQIKVGDTANLKVQLRGQGNFAAVGNLELTGLDPSFEVFEGGVPASEKAPGGDTVKSWVFALVPKDEGEFQIPVPELAYFDLAGKRYRTIGGSNLDLEVLPGQGLVSSGPSNTEERILIAEESLSFINLEPLAGDQRPWLASPLHLVRGAAVILFLDMLLFLGLMARTRFMSRRMDMRPAFAYKNFRKATARLKTSDSPDDFFAGLSQAILDYFGDKWERPGKGVSLEMIHEHFHREGLDEETYRRVAECIEACDLARFTPSSTASREQLLEKTKATIQAVEGVLS